MDETVTKVCPHCSSVQPLDRFKRRSRREGQRESWCRDCINAAERDRRRRQRMGIIRGLGQRIRHGTAAERTRAVVAATVQRLGGVNAVAEELSNAFHNAKSARESLSIIRLIVHMDEAGR